MATTNIAYATATDLAITSADGNGDGVWCSSAIFDNSSNLYMDATVNGTLQVGTVTADGTLDFYIDYSLDGTEFNAGCSAGDGDITWGTTGSTTVNGEFNLTFAGSYNVDATDDDSDFPFAIPSIAALCNGVMPKKFCIVVENNTGAALHATGTNNHIDVNGITFTSA